MVMSGINKNEMRYILFAVIFSLIWFLLVIPYMLGSGVEDSNPYFQFLIFNVGIFIFLQIFLKAKTLRKGIDVKNSLGLIFLIMAIDVMIPPFLVTQEGTLLNSVILKSSGTDYIIGYFAINSLGLSGMAVFLFTYILIPAVLLFFAAKLLPHMVRSL